MPLTDGDKKAGWAAVIVLLTIVALISATMVWLVGPPTWHGSLTTIASVVLLLAFGPALARWAGTSVRRTFLVALAVFVATSCVEALRSGLPVWEWRGLVGLVLMSLVQTFGVLVILAALSLLRLPASRGPAIDDRDEGDGGREAEKSR